MKLSKHDKEASELFKAQISHKIYSDFKNAD
jgi:hypothetical protein